MLDHLPNELLSFILANIDIIDLLLLRGVNSRWLAVIEALCHLAQSLILTNVGSLLYLEDFWLNPNEFATIKTALNVHISPDFCTFLVRSLPNLHPKTRPNQKR